MLINKILLKIVYLYVHVRTYVGNIHNYTDFTLAYEWNNQQKEHSKADLILGINS